MLAFAIIALADNAVAQNFAIPQVPDQRPILSDERLEEEALEVRAGDRQVDPFADDAETIEVSNRMDEQTDSITLESRGEEGRVGEDGLFSLNANQAELSAVLQMIAQYHELNLVLGPTVSGPVTVSFNSARLDEILDAILSVSGYTWHRHGNLLYVTRLSEEGTSSPMVQGREVRVFPLNYVPASEAQSVVTGLLSPVGQVFISESSDSDSMRTQELLIVEDIPSSLFRIEEYLVQIDQPPRQVLIEAHVLQVGLSDDERHGINLTALANAAGSSVSLSTVGLANDNASPASFFRIEGTDLDGVLEMLRSHSFSETLASPKVMVVNRQRAEIQIGSKLGYFVTTTTQTSTLQSVEFLDVGVVLTVTPVITADNRVLLTVEPKVSGGRINPATQLPEEETTQVTSTILLRDGGGIVIGGLIKESVTKDESRVPVLADLPGVGKLFRKKSNTTARDEIIIALVTRIIGDEQHGVRPHEERQLYRTLPDHARESLWQGGASSRQIETIAAPGAYAEPAVIQAAPRPSSRRLKLPAPMR